MFLKDHLKDSYQKASFDKNHLLIENIINRWAHRFGIESLNELIVNDQDQIKLKEEDQLDENHNKVNLELLEDVQYDEEIDFMPKETEKLHNTETIDKEIYCSSKNKNEYKETEELPLPNINSLRKWINNEKKAG